jgi:hypothetical protein
VLGITPDDHWLARDSRLMILRFYSAIFVPSTFLFQRAVKMHPPSATAYTSNFQCCRSIRLPQERAQQGTVWIQVRPPDSIFECLPCSCCSGKTAINNSAFLVPAIRAEQDNRSILCFGPKHNRSTIFGSSEKELFP